MGLSTDVRRVLACGGGMSESFVRSMTLGIGVDDCDAWCLVLGAMTGLR